jgi:hypothetical protein
MSLGMTPTVSGLATISAEVTPDCFEALFGVAAREIAPRSPGQTDFGKSGGQASPKLTVPQPLTLYVEGISPAPPHLYLQH